MTAGTCDSGDVSHCHIYRRREAVKMCGADGYTVVTLPEINGYEMIALEKE